MVNKEKLKSDWRPAEMATLAVGRLSRALLKLDDARLKPVGITVSQLPVLVALKHGDALTQKELAQKAGVEQPSMAQLLNRMERDGLISRAPAPGDKRSSLVSLTEQAQRQLETGREVLRTIEGEVCAGLSATEQELLLVLLKRLLANTESSLSRVTSP